MKTLSVLCVVLGLRLLTAVGLPAAAWDRLICPCP